MANARIQAVRAARAAGQRKTKNQKSSRQERGLQRAQYNQLRASGQRSVVKGGFQQRPRLTTIKRELSGRTGVKK